MTFRQPELILLFVLLPALCVLMVMGARQNKKKLSRFIQPEQWANMVPLFSKKRRFYKQILFILALSAIIVSLMQPQFGSKLDVKKRRGLELYFAVDTSLSMLTEDLSPNRLGRAKQEMTALISKMNGNQVGLMGFAGKAAVLCPRTFDDEALALFVNDIEAGSIQPSGTRLAPLLTLATRSYGRGRRSNRALIIFSDGETLNDNAQSAIKQIANKGIRVFTVGIGTEKGAPIPIPDELGQVTQYKRDRQDKIVLSRLQTKALQQVANETGGQFMISNAQQLAVEPLYRALSQLEKDVLAEDIKESKQDRYHGFLLLALLFLLLDSSIAFRRRENDT